MPRLYVCSGPLLDSNGNLHQHLIGILNREKKRYTFRYRLDDTTENDFLMLSIFPDKEKIYNDEETRILLDDFLPSENNTAFISEILKKAELPREYNEWAWLCAFEACDSDGVQLFEKLPDGIIRHDADLDDEFEEDDNADIEDDIDDDGTPYYDDDIVENDMDADLNDMPDDESMFDNSDDIDDADDADDIDIDIDDLLGDLLSDIPEEQSVLEQAELIQTLEPAAQPEKKQNVIKIVTVKTTKKIITKDTTDFIQPPPESPMTEIQRRFEENKKQRKEKLDAELKLVQANNNKDSMQTN